LTFTYYNGGLAEDVSVWGAVVVEEFFVIDVVVVWFFTDSGIPQIFDSVELTKSSFGLLGLHILAFCSG
jgi:hypothetical protein